MTTIIAPINVCGLHAVMDPSGMNKEVTKPAMMVTIMPQITAQRNASQLNVEMVSSII